MKNFLLCLLFCFFSWPLFCQDEDSIIYESPNILLTQDIENKSFRLTNLKGNDKFENLKFVRRIVNYFQVLDQANNLFYLNEDWEQKVAVDDFVNFATCGFGGHLHELKVELVGEQYKITEEDTFFADNIPVELKIEINKNEADSVLFINGKNVFHFMSNITDKTTNPRKLILVKDGKYFTKEAPFIKYDAIDFTNFFQGLISKRNDLFGILGLIEPKFKNIESFEYYLAKAELPNGNVIFVDLEGNEY